MKKGDKLNIGDKLLCKRDCYTSIGVNFDDIKKRFNKGEEYIIVKKDIEFTDVDEEFYKLAFGSDFDNFDSVWFTNNILNDAFIYIWKHFYTKKEVRKLKLDKINERRK